MMTPYLSGTYYIEYGTSQIEYELIYTEREELAIHVYPDCSVVVEAPLDSDTDVIQSKLKKRAKWIVKQQQTFREYISQEPNRLYVSGETHFYLGRRYRLKVIEADFERVGFHRGRIFLNTKNPDDWQHKYNLMQRWYRTRARFIFNERLNMCYRRFKGVDIPFPELQTRAMKSQWGSCTPSGKIILNLKLIQLPKKLIDYVIIHELCHLKEHHHGQSFYVLLSRIMPDWEALREELNRFEFT
jgi:predicted metal-dependent hydrolase